MCLPKSACSSFFVSYVLKLYNQVCKHQDLIGLFHENTLNIMNNPYSTIFFLLKSTLSLNITIAAFSD